MILSVAEYVVKRELKAEGAMIIGLGGTKIKQPSLVALLGVKVISFEGKKNRSLARPIT